MNTIRNQFCILSLVVIFIFPLSIMLAQSGNEIKPNVVIIFLDDSGWSDFQPFNRDISYTPNMDQLAKEGCSFSNFYVPQAVCSASRAALLTGCYPGRTKIFGALKPKERGLDSSFPTIAEIFKDQGYKTAMFGKWHLGDTEETRPWNRGFDETAGLLYSHDMWKYHPVDPATWGKYPLQFWENGKVLILDMEVEDQKSLTKRYTDYAVDFIRKNKKEPFLLYVPHNMPHVPIYTGKDFEGKSGMGAYADNIMELDWSIGQINQAIKENGLEENTIFIVTSDNGPWLAYGNHAGKTPFREGKTTSFDGGLRLALLFKYPKIVEGGSFSNSTFFSIDILPTLTELTGISFDKEKLDGKSVAGLIKKNPEFQNPQEYYAISNLTSLEAIISSDGKWKLHVAHPYITVVKEGGNGVSGKYERRVLEVSLFNIEKDPFEMQNVAKKHPEVVNKLTTYYNYHYKKFYKTLN